MCKDKFAARYGYENYKELLSASYLLKRKNNMYWYIVQTALGFLVWLDDNNCCHMLNMFSNFETARTAIIGPIEHRGIIKRVLHWPLHLMLSIA